MTRAAVYCRMLLMGTLRLCFPVSRFRKVPRELIQKMMVRGLNTVLRITRDTDRETSPLRIVEK